MLYVSRERLRKFYHPSAGLCFMSVDSDRGKFYHPSTGEVKAKVVSVKMPLESASENMFSRLCSLPVGSD